MGHGVLHDGLEKKPGNRSRADPRIHVPDHPEARAETRLLDGQIPLDKAELLVQRHGAGIGYLEGVAKQVGERLHHLLRLGRIGLEQGGDRVERVEEEVRVDSSLEGRKFGTGRLFLEARLHEADLFHLPQGLGQAEPEPLVDVHDTSDNQGKNAVDGGDGDGQPYILQDEQRKEVENQCGAGHRSGDESKPQDHHSRHPGKGLQSRKQHQGRDESSEADHVPEEDANQDHGRLDAAGPEGANRQADRRSCRRIGGGPEKDLDLEGVWGRPAHTALASTRVTSS